VPSLGLMLLSFTKSPYTVILCLRTLPLQSKSFARYRGRSPRCTAPRFKLISVHFTWFLQLELLLPPFHLMVPGLIASIRPSWHCHSFQIPLFLDSILALTVVWDVGHIHTLRTESPPLPSSPPKAKAFTPCTPPLWCCTSLIFLTGVVVISTQVQRPVITHPRCCRAIDSSLTTGPHAVTVMILTQVQGPVTIQLCLHSSPSSLRDNQTSSRHHAPRTCRPLGTCASTS
jgi:hypothetical protein